MIKNFFKGFWKGFTYFGPKITKVINFILLFPVYFIGVGSVSIVSKLFFKKNFLNIKLEKKESYWEPWPKKEREDFKRMF